MRKIEDYFGTKTAIKCENEQQWKRLRKLCGDRYKGKLGFVDYMPFFCLSEEEDMEIGWSISDIYGHTILPYSDFVNDVPELVGVEMEVSFDGENWKKRLVYGHCDRGYICEPLLLLNHARPIQPKKVLTATLEELAEKLGVDQITIK